MSDTDIRKVTTINANSAVRSWGLISFKSDPDSFSCWWKVIFLLQISLYVAIHQGIQRIVRMLNMKISHDSVKNHELHIINSPTENIPSPIDISAPIRMRNGNSPHEYIHFRHVYQIARQRKAKNIGYIRRDIIWKKSVIVDGQLVPKNGDPLIFCHSV